MIHKPPCSKIRQFLIVILVPPFVCARPSISDALLTRVEDRKEARLFVRLEIANPVSAIDLLQFVRERLGS
jgi:hypothetical protein